MKKYNPKNERVKTEYLRHLKNAKGRSEATLTLHRAALARFEQYTGYKDFSTFNDRQAEGFKKKLLAMKNQRTGEPISKSTAFSTLNAQKDFFAWLAGQPGFKSRVKVSDIEYFNMMEKDISIAKSAKPRNFPSLAQIRKVVFSMPVATDIQRRNRALIAFAIVTGMRDAALASVRLRHIDTYFDLPRVRQEPDLVQTKFSKTITTYFFPVGDDLFDIVLDWIKELREIKFYGELAPVFPRTKSGHDENRNFSPQGLEPECWATAAPIRQIFKESFTAAGLPYFNPHSFRHTLAHIAQQYCRTPEELKAWSQNLGHENVMTTMTSYGKLDPYRQGEVIGKISLKKDDSDMIAKMRKVLAEG